jgi:hypothetical protein
MQMHSENKSKSKNNYSKDWHLMQVHSENKSKSKE